MLKRCTLLLLFLASTTSADPTDRKCGSDISNLWLDLVLVVDNSAHLGASALAEVSALLGTSLGNIGRFGSGYPDPRSTRVAVITFNSNSTVVADLDKIRSADDYYNTIFSLSPSPSQDSFIGEGLVAAENVLEAGRSDGARRNYKQLVILITSAYQGPDPEPIADRMKTSGVSIVTVGMDVDGDPSFLQNLANIASPGFNFTDLDLNLVGELQTAVFETNCFCPPLWTQYRALFSDPTSSKYGVCVRPSSLESTWTAAKLSCQNLFKNGYLVTEYTDQKHDFVFDVAQSLSTKLSSYHIGLNYVNAGWHWQQPAGWPLVPLGNYTKWNYGYPGSASLTGVHNNKQNSKSDVVGWENFYAYQQTDSFFCEVVACDTDNYCA